MYGFLRAQSCLLNQPDRESYKLLYCGQCAALQKLFGYPWRALVSYDAVFLALLLSAQLDEAPEEDKSWCAVFPKMMKVCSPNDLSSVFSACMAILIFSLKIADARQERRPYWKGWLERYCTSEFRKAKDILTSLNFPTELFETVSAEQQRIESTRRRDIAAYAEPSARFLAEVFRFPAKITKNAENEEALYELGYHVGRIIYLVDSCLDILDDIEKKEFNALLASYANDQESVSSDARTEITQVVMDSLRQISTSVKTFYLERYQGIIENILLGGFPAIIQYRIQRSVKKLEKDRPLLLKYLPHTALASALCLVTAQNADAGECIAWGDKVEAHHIAYGLPCFGRECVCCDILVNPCVCIMKSGTDPCSQCFNCCWQVPKTAITGFFVGLRIQVIQKRWEERRKRFEQEEEERRRREVAEADERHRQEAAELKRRNQEYIDRAMTEINSIESFFNNYPLNMGKKVIPQNFKDEILNFVGSHQNEELSVNKELKQLISGKTEECFRAKSRFEDAMMIHNRALDIYKNLETHMKNSRNMSLIKELELDYAELMSENVKILLADRRWDDFKEVVRTIIDDMERLQMQSEK